MAVSPAAPASSAHSLPRPGMMAIVRKRRGVIASVEKSPAAEEGDLHLVTVEYTDTNGPHEERLIWEREPQARVVPPLALPRVLADRPMMTREFQALEDTTRWSAVTPFLSPDDTTVLAKPPVASPFYGAVQSEDFQLVPLLKAMQMPRVSLMLADDVGLGKTIEAGMILRELLLRRRARRVLILTPASLREQWSEELHDKFSLTFDIVDREATQRLKKDMGIDANPWRTFPRIIASYHYLRQPNILEEFRAASRPNDKQPHTKAKLPWDLLIVDEAHNLMPSSYGEDSQLAKMLRDISPWFEHKLFLTATPHNGYTRSFTGLLESLDPVRFQQKSELNERDKERIHHSVVRRLKRDINALDESRNGTRRFAKRKLNSLDVNFDAAERTLIDAFERFRNAVKETVRYGGGSELAANFAVQILNKRLLSSPYTFADSWLRFTEGLHRDEGANERQVRAARQATEQDIDDDRERESLDRHAARTTGAWLKSIRDEVADEVDAIHAALDNLGIGVDAAEISKDGASIEQLPEPSADGRYDALRDLVEEWLYDDDGWSDNERLIIFTEYKTTLDYLINRLRADFDDPDGRRILFLFGGMSQSERREVKRAFNDPDHPVRILVGTDAASEGLNLQETARLLLHFDVPWNPSRLDQRNGRLDRHGQARDVHIFHFGSEDNADLEFMGRVVSKVEEIREDLGSMGEVFDAAFESRFIDQQDVNTVVSNLDADANRRRGRTEQAHTGIDEERLRDSKRVEEFRKHIGLSPDRLRNALEVALAIGTGYPQLDATQEDGRYRFHGGTVPADWRQVVEEELLVDPNKTGGSRRIRGALPKLVFDPQKLVDDSSGRPVFRNPGDTALMHLGHSVFEHVLSRFARARFPIAGEDNATRWLAREGKVPRGADALIRLSIEELAVNELREPFHHWVRTLTFPIHDHELGDVLPYEPPITRPDAQVDTDAVDRARLLWSAVEPHLLDHIEARRDALTKRIYEALEVKRAEELDAARRRFENRIKEVNQHLQHQNVPALTRQLEKQRRDALQMSLLASEERELQKQIQNSEAELQRRKKGYDNLLERLKSDQTRMLEQVLPKRYSLAGDVQVFPVTVEILLPSND